MKKLTKQNASVSVPITYLGSYWKGELSKLPANRTYVLVIDYPFGGERTHLFTIKTGKKGLGVIALLGKIGQAYEKIYEDPDKYGVFGHGIDDLHLVGININHKTKRITLQVDS